jgi:pimeloyl-ACP methyl ester carboxylesterase
MQKQFNYKGENVVYHTEGNGAATVLIHGFAEDGTVWDAQTTFLQQRYRVIVPHLPGSGQSAYNPGLLSMEDHAEVIFALLQQENIPHCIMIGHSMGGYITLAFAEKYPAYLTGFGFVHSTAFADSEEKKQNRQKGIAMMEDQGGYAFIKNTMPNLFSAAYKMHSQDKIDGLVEKGAAFKKEALQQYYRAMMARPDRTLVLKNSTVPVLFIAGKEDAAVPLSDVLKQVHLPATAHIHILEHAGHMGMWEEAAKTNEYLAAYFHHIDEYS